MISSYYGKEYALEELRKLCGVTRLGVSLRDISNGANAVGFDTGAVKVSLKTLEEEIPLPCILHWRQDHFVVLYDILKNRKNRFVIADPGFGLTKMSDERFQSEWYLEDGKGILLLLQPGEGFETLKPKIPIHAHWKRSWNFLAKYLKKHKVT